MAKLWNVVMGIGLEVSFHPEYSLVSVVFSAFLLTIMFSSSNNTQDTALAKLPLAHPH